jgi:hypothetical protein
MPAEPLDVPDDTDDADDIRRPYRPARRRDQTRSAWREPGSRRRGPWTDFVDTMLELPTAGKVAIASQVAMFASMAWLGWNASIHAPWSAINVILVEIAFDESGASLPWTVLIAAVCIAGPIFQMQVSPLIPAGVVSWGLVASLCGWLARAVAVESRRGQATLLGVALGPVGVIAAALMVPDHTGRN